MLLRAILLLIILTAAGAQAAPIAYPTQPYALTTDDKAILARIETYLSGIKTVTAEFTQASAQGDITTGTFFLEKPGKLRMEYNDPTPILMVASGGDIVYYDKELDQVTHLPMESTLVGFLAREKVQFDNTVIITHMEHVPGSITLSLIQSKKPKDGALTLEFSDSPLLIRNMVVTNSAGQKTTVSLNNARFDHPLDADLFIFHDPHIGKRQGIKG